MNKGLLIAFEGLDGSGKETQARLFVDYLKQKGHNVGYFTFPDYGKSFFSTEISAYLNGAYGQLNSIDARFISLLYACERFEYKKEICEKLSQNNIVVCNRYVYSNIAFQGAKNPAEFKKLKEWICKVEFDIFELPRADICFYLKINTHISQVMVDKKQIREYTDKKRDLHENNNDFLSRVAVVYDQLAGDDNWITIDCLSDQGMKSIDEIGAEITTEITDFI